MDSAKNNKVTIVIIMIFIAIGIFVFFSTRKDNLELEIKSEYLRDYKINEVIPVYVSKEAMAKKYLTDYINLMLNEPVDAYELLTNNCKKSRFTNLNIFESYINKRKKNGKLTTIVKKYSYSTENDKTIIKIIDENNIKYKFIETTIMNYEVEIY